LPPPIRSIDAFEKVTGPAGIRVTYPLDAEPGQARRRQRRQDGQGRVATLMIRHVRRDSHQIVRHVVREVRDETATRLSYDTCLAECVFRRDSQPTTAHGAGALHLTRDHAAIGALPPGEQERVRAMLADLQTAYRRQCTYLGSDRLRSVLRTYIEDLNAIRVRPTGGVYFVHRQHADTLAALRELVHRFGACSHLARVPLPDQEEMREMVITAFTTKSREDLDRLARDIAAAQRDGDTAPAAVQALHKAKREIVETVKETAREQGRQLQELAMAVEAGKARAQAAELTAAKGFGYEAMLQRGLAAIAAVHGDIAEPVGRKTGLSGTLKGDHLVTVNPEDTYGEEARFVIECKDRRLSMAKPMEELGKAMDYHAARAAVAVFSRAEHAPMSAPVLLVRH